MLDADLIEARREAYRDKVERRRESLEVRAEAARQEAAHQFQRSDDAVRGIEPGQPILVGHHSERRHRRDLDRSWTALGKGVQATRKAERLEARAAVVGTAGISSDDPDAPDALRAKLAKLETWQTTMKAANTAYRKGGIEALTAVVGERAAQECLDTLRVCPWERAPFPGYALTNNNANMRRIKERIASLETRVASEAPSNETWIGPEVAVTICEDAIDNRVRLYFPGKPSEVVRTALKRAGFRWSPSVGAWQRQANTRAWAAARYALESVGFTRDAG